MHPLAVDAKRAKISRVPQIEVERRKAIDLPYETFLREYVAINRPIVVEGAGAAWPALKKWTPEYFKTQFGSKLVDVSYTERMRFADFIDAVLASTAENPGPYMFRFFICVHLPELLQDIEPPNPYSFPRRLASPLMPRSWRRPDGYLKLLIGGVGGRFPVLHFDGENFHAAITEIHGEKEFLLYPPEDSAYLYPKSDVPNLSQLSDLENPSLERFPLFARATRYRTVLTPGDTVFVPSRWWHTARVLSPSVSVCTNQIDESNWNGFVREACLPNSRESALKLEAKRAILWGLGKTLSVLEPLGRRDGWVPARMSEPIGRLAPWSPAEAVSSRDWPIRKWHVRSADSY